MKSMSMRTFFSPLLNLNFSFGFCFVAIILLISLSCSDKMVDPDVDKGDVIAEVFGEKLFSEELKDMMPDNAKSDDSTLIANALVDRWTRKQVLLYNGKKDAIDRDEIERLVEDYRESLILHEYEEKLLQQFSDTTVTKEQVQTFFEENPGQFKLKKPIAKFNLAVFPKNSIEDSYNEVKKLWDGMDDAVNMNIDLIKYLDLYAEDFILDTSWYAIDELQTALPENINLSLLKKSHRLELEDQESYYFLKIIEIAEETDDAPLSYIRNFAHKTILQRRKMKWLEKIKEDLYQEAASNNKIIKYEN